LLDKTKVSQTKTIQKIIWEKLTYSNNRTAKQKGKLKISNRYEISKTFTKIKNLETYVTELDQDMFIGKPMSQLTNEPILV